MDLTAADGGGGRRRGAGGDAGDANGDSETAVEPNVGVAAHGGTDQCEGTERHAGGFDGRNFHI